MGQRETSVMMNTVIIPLFLLAVLGVCQEESTDLEETFNPDTLTEPPLKWPTMLYPGDQFPEKPPAGVRDTTEEGFRVQVTSTQSIETADSLRDELSGPFGGQVYVAFDPPNYKIRVGNYLFRSDAEKGAEKVRRLGFRGAWVIRTRIEARSTSQPE